MVFTVQCPNPDCRKYMLVEQSAQNKTVQCLICKCAIHMVGKASGKSKPAKNK